MRDHIQPEDTLKDKEIKCYAGENLKYFLKIFLLPFQYDTFMKKLLSNLNLTEKITKQSHDILEPTQKFLASFDNCAMKSVVLKVGVLNRLGRN